MSARELIDWTLQKSRLGHAGRARSERAGSTASRISTTAHYLDGFAYPDGKFRFKPDWPKVPFRSRAMRGPIAAMPKLPDHWTVIEEADAAHPFRLATSPARGFLNSTFNETPTSRAQESGRPEVMIHPDDAGALGIARRRRGRARQRARRGAAARAAVRRRAARRADRGIDLAERRLSRRPRHQHADRRRPIAPYGGAAFHDNTVWLRRRAAVNAASASIRPPGVGVDADSGRSLRAGPRSAVDQEQGLRRRRRGPCRGSAHRIGAERCRPSSSSKVMSRSKMHVSTTKAISTIDAQRVW